MAADTIPRITVVLPSVTAQALWAAMHDDDELAEDYVNLAVIHALNHLLRDADRKWYTTSCWKRFVLNLQEARSGAIMNEEDMVERFQAYTEPPF